MPQERRHKLQTLQIYQGQSFFCLWLEYIVKVSTVFRFMPVPLALGEV